MSEIIYFYHYIPHMWTWTYVLGLKSPVLTKQQVSEYFVYCTLQFSVASGSPTRADKFRLKCTAKELNTPHTPVERKLVTPNILRLFK